MDGNQANVQFHSCCKPQSGGFCLIQKQLHSHPGGDPTNQKPPLAEPASDWLSAEEIVPDGATPMGGRPVERGNQSD